MSLKLLSILASVALCCAAFAQTYRPEPGETALRIEIEGKGLAFVALRPDVAPKAVAHIVSLAESGFYDGQRFHRVEREPRPFLVSAGDPSSVSGDLDDESMGSGGTGARIPYEDSGLDSERGAVALSALLDEPGIGDSQFFVLLGDFPFVAKRYTVFGNVVRGMDVIDRVERGDRIVSVSVLRG